MVININDDRMIMEFLSGRYLGVPDGHTVYMNYPLTGFLAILYRLLPQVDWYGYFLAAVMAVCAGLIIYRMTGQGEMHGKKWLCLIASLGMLCFAIGREFFSVTYTTVAAITGATAVLWYGTSQEKKKDLMITAVLAALTWCIRDELFFMILPAAGLIFLWKELPVKEKLWKKIVTPLAVLGLTGLCMLVNCWMYSGEDWQRYQAFNQLRTEIYDYQDTYYFPNYDEYTEYYERLGLTREERRMMIYYNFTLVQDEIGREEVIELFQKMIDIRGDYGVNEELLPLRQRIPVETKDFLVHSLTGAYGKLFNLSILGFLMLAIWEIRKKDWFSLLRTLCFAGAGAGLFLVMEIRGRMPDRVVYSLSLLLFTTMVVNLWWNREEIFQNRFLKKCIQVASWGCSLVGVVSCVLVISANRPFMENEKELVQIQNYCKECEENFYFVTGEVLDEYGGVICAPFKNNEQLNYISTGDWISYSPIESMKLEQNGITSVSEALLYDKNVYLISVKDSANLGFITDYLSLRAGYEVMAKEVEGLTEEYAVYRFE